MTMAQSGCVDGGGAGVAADGYVSSATFPAQHLTLLS